MDQDSAMAQQIQPQQNESNIERNQSSSQYQSKALQNQENRIVRRPGRPPSRIKNPQKNFIKTNELQNQNDDEFQGQRHKLKQKSYSSREQRENNIQGFIKIIDYLKKIQCDETSLHNKMNPYNLLTPTCFWYMVSAEYFSFDFFNNKNPHEVALQFLKRAQKTQIVLPTRIIKPQKVSTQLEFQTQQLKQAAAPITEKLTYLTGNIATTSQNFPEILQKSNFISSISDDNHFRSSTKAIVFNWIKKKISSSQKWSSSLKPKFESSPKIQPKQFTSKIYEFQQQKKHQQLDVAPQVYYRQRKVQKSPIQIQRNRQPRRQITKQKKNSKKQKQKQDQIYDQSQSEDIKKQQEKMVNLNQVKIQKNEQQMLQNKQQRENIQQIANKQQKCQVQIKKQEDIVAVEQKIEQKQNNLMQKSLPNQYQEENSEQMIENGTLKDHQLLVFNKNYKQDDILLDAIMHMPIDNIINILRSSIQTPRLHQIPRPYMPTPKNDPLQLVYQIHPQQEVFLNYMKQRQEKMYLEKSCHTDSMIQQKQRQVQVEDAKCQVCTDGDYTQDNLIVFCSMCNISLHQRCVGLAKVPADNWICQVCSSFGPAGINVPCPLCNVKGGALKRTSIHINTPLFKDTNPQYHQFAKKCPNYKHKQEYAHPARVGGKEQQPYYDYFAKATYPEDQPVCHFVWVHYVCAIWIPQCYFEEKNGLINIKGVQNIDKKRFKQKCLICKQMKAGACVKCDNQNCTKFYHPQCARKKRIYMEQLNLDKLKYLIFCEAHQPLKVKRKIQIKKKKQRDQIVKFCRGIQKYVQTYKIANLPFKLLKIGLNNTEVSKLDSNKKQKSLLGDQKIMIKMQKNSDEDFIKSVIDGLVKQNQIVINVTHLGNNRYKVDEIIKPSKRDMRKSLTRQEQFWKNFKNTQSPEQNLKRFNTIMRENNYLKQKIQNFINFGSSAEDKPLKDDKKFNRSKIGRRGPRKVQTVVEQQGAIFCVCRKPYDGEDDMFECQVCNEWYHHECIGFIGSQQDAQKLVFHCMKCLKYQSSETKKELLDKCARFFSEDSLFLNYRPPTPSLQSEQEDQKINYEKSEHLKKKQNVEHLEPGNRKPDRQQKQKRKNSSYLNILDGDIQQSKINILQPFVIIETRPMRLKQTQTNLKEKIMEQQHQNNSQSLPNFGRLECPEQLQKDKDQKSLEKGVDVMNQQISLEHIKIYNMEPQKVEAGQNKYAEVNQVCHIVRPLSSQSSQLLTPQFRPSAVSFGPIEQEGNEKVIKQNIMQDQNDSIEKRQQNSYIQRNNEILVNNFNFQFNRMQIQKLKNSIQEKQKEQKDEKGEHSMVDCNQKQQN